MTTPLQMSGRGFIRHAQNVRSLFFRESSSTSGTPNSALKSDKNHDNNSLIQPVFHNRNPRNLELMTIATKPQGYHLDSFVVEFYHKLVVSSSQSRVIAEIVHNTDQSIISASSSEFSIRKFLYRPVDVSAFKAVGKVLAQRCLESGINSVFCDIEADEGTKLALLLKEAQKAGLSLKEVPNYTFPFKHSKGNPTKPWDIVT